MKISEAALKLHIPRHYIDYWRKTGLLGDAGVLNFQDLLKIRFLATCRRQGISLQRVRRLVRECEAERVEDWYNQFQVYDNLSGVLLSRRGGELAHPDTGQLFFAYSEDEAAETGTRGSGAGSGVVVALEDRRPQGDGEVADGPGEQWLGGQGDPAIAGLEEEYLRVLATGDFRRISKVLGDIIKQRPDHVAALIEFGNLCYENDRLTDALQYYERALELQDDCVEALYNVANIHFKAKRYAAAIRTFQRCIELDPEFPEAYYNLGLLYYSLQYFEQGIDCLHGYTTLDPDSIWADQARQLIEDMESARSAGADQDRRNLSLFE